MGTLEGVIRQTTRNELKKRMLITLIDKKEVTAYSIVRRGDSVHVETEQGEMPVFTFKMNSELQALLTDYREVWDV